MVNHLTFAQLPTNVQTSLAAQFETEQDLNDALNIDDLKIVEIDGTFFTYSHDEHQSHVFDNNEWQEFNFFKLLEQINKK